MNVVLKEPYASSAIGNLFRFYKASELHGNSSYESYLHDSQLFLNQADEKVKAELSSVDTFLNEKMFVFDTGISVRDKYNLIIGFENFCKATSDQLNDHRAEFLDMKGLERTDLPDIRAFDYVGHNELNIPMSLSNYALLFR